jgi:hypothetical protein
MTFGNIQTRQNCTTMVRCTIQGMHGRHQESELGISSYQEQNEFGCSASSGRRRLCACCTIRATEGISMNDASMSDPTLTPQPRSRRGPP